MADDDPDDAATIPTTSTDVLVIGGLVDKCVQRGLSLARATHLVRLASCGVDGKLRASL